MDNKLNETVPDLPNSVLFDILNNDRMAIIAMRSRTLLRSTNISWAWSLIDGSIYGVLAGQPTIKFSIAKDILEVQSQSQPYMVMIPKELLLALETCPSNANACLTQLHINNRTSKSWMCSLKKQFELPHLSTPISKRNNVELLPTMCCRYVSLGVNLEEQSANSKNDILKVPYNAQMLWNMKKDGSTSIIFNAFESMKVVQLGVTTGYGTATFPVSLIFCTKLLNWLKHLGATHIQTVSIFERSYLRLCSETPHGSIIILISELISEDLY